MTARAPILIALPSGLTTGGVQTWAARCLRALAGRGRATGLIIHNPGINETVGLDPSVRRFDLSGLPPLSQANGDLSHHLPAYRAAVLELHERTNAPVIAVPNLLGDCYGLFAQLTRELPGLLRTVGWCHLDIPYDVRILEHYEAILHRFVPVSRHLGSVLASRLPSRAGHIRLIPYGVEVPGSCPTRAAAASLRIIYVGRLDDGVKRVGSLPFMSQALRQRGISHTITVVGDGPARAALEAAAARLGASLTLLGPRGLAEISDLLAGHDLFVLPSRVEGLSLAMLEALAHGCVPVVSRIDSGATQMIDHGRNGILVDIEPSAPFQLVGECMAQGVADAAELGLAGLAAEAWRTVAAGYSVDHNADLVEALIDEVAAEPARAWPMDRPTSFTMPPGGGPSGTVPPDAADRLRGLLRSLQGRRVILHGTGRHTLELAHVIAEFGATVIGFTDDEPTRHGEQVLGLPVFSPGRAAASGATDAVISSWINQQLIWSLRSVYEDQGVRVHRLYPQAA